MDDIKYMSSANWGGLRRVNVVKDPHLNEAILSKLSFDWFKCIISQSYNDYLENEKSTWSILDHLDSYKKWKKKFDLKSVPYIT